jgi:ankyrin repeat protein
MQVGVEPLLEADLNEDEVYLWEAIIIRRESLEVVRSIVESMPELVRVVRTSTDDDEEEEEEEEDDDNEDEEEDNEDGDDNEENDNNGRGIFFPLHDAVEFGSPLEIVEYIYSCCPAAIGVRGKPAAAYPFTDSAATGSLPLHCVTPATPPECVACLVNRYPKALAMRNDRGELPLHSALRNGADRRLIQMLVERRPTAIAERDAHGFLPIHVAAAATTATGQDRLDVIRYLVELAPMSVRERTKPLWGNPNTQGFLPLHLFLQAERFERDPRHAHGEEDEDEDEVEPETDQDVVRLLLEQWPESVHERAESSLPLHLALLSASPSAEVVRIVRDAHPEALQEKDHDGSTVVHRAVRNGSMPHEVLRLLVEARPELLLEADDAGDLPIHVALREGLPTVESTVELLADRCPPSMRVANAHGHRPMHVAILTDNVGAVQMFAKLSPDGFRETDAQGNTPAHLAAACDYASAELATLVVEAWPESLLATNGNGDTPIHVAIDRAFPSSEALEVFLEKCPESLRVANAHGIHPLGVAIARNHLPIVNLLVEKVPDSAQQVDPRGNCPLFLAAESAKMDLNVVFLLLKAWPDVVVLGGGGDARSQKRRRSPSMG